MTRRFRKIRLDESIIKRFWQKVDKKSQDECWNWTACTRGKNRPSIIQDNRHLLASRVSWTIHNGPVPAGGLILHTCDSELCVNPHHLYLGDYSDNNQDRESRNPGTAGMISRLGASNIQNIIDLYKTGLYNQNSLAKKFGISLSYISMLIAGKRGKHTLSIG